MRTKLSLLVLLVAALCLSSLVRPTPVRAEAETFHEESDVPFDTLFPDPCTGEDIHIMGTDHRIMTLTTDGRETCFMDGGGYHLRIEDHFVDVSAEGVTSGITYQLVGASNLVTQRLGNV